MLTVLGILAMALTPNAPPSEGDRAPIYLVAEPAGDGVHLKVVGSSDVEYRATYTLEVTSDVTRGGNRSSQTSSARLRPGDPVTLTTVKLGNVGRWRAHLKVVPQSQPSYEEVRSAS